MADTRALLIDHATTLIRRQGYAAFSYADLADVVKIRKASIHHHFPAKDDLALAVVQAYSENFFLHLDAIRGRRISPRKMLEAYADRYREGLQHGQACLCGMMAADVLLLSDRVKAALRLFFDRNHAWLEDVLRAARDAGALAPPTAIPPYARTLLAGLQGAMLVARVSDSVAPFDDALTGLLAPMTGAR